MRREYIYLGFCTVWCMIVRYSVTVVPSQFELYGLPVITGRHADHWIAFHNVDTEAAAVVLCCCDIQRELVYVRGAQPFQAEGQICKCSVRRGPQVSLHVAERKKNNNTNNDIIYCTVYCTVVCFTNNQGLTPMI